MKSFENLLFVVFVVGSISAMPQIGTRNDANTDSELQQLKGRIENLYSVVSQLEMKVLSVGTTQPVTCPKGYTEFQGSCYMFVNTLMNWADAQRNCQASNGNLVSIQSAAEQDFLTSYALANSAQFPGNGFWTGGFDQGAKGLFKWVANNKLYQTDGDFLGWDYFDGGHAQGGQDCMALWKSRGYLWHDYECHGKVHSICEINEL
ncbi:ladderlectin-like [Lingula anatina]|uniref:Ladderlectin-like n=1 Tax=Lingula anatina TaxID=7574 RepID=A0A1S3HGA5_LINAN|nr:ladderlectin-like [Lingula anatina]|eukprot:XP_013385087.1 ladderlectin-like [Lingula anatina]